MTPDDHAQEWAETILDGLHRQFPWGAAHQSSGPDDVDVTPWRLHPCFHGCLDWHSSAHMQWSAVTLLTRCDEAVDPGTTRRLVDTLDERLTEDNARVEAAYLAAHTSYERPYGWGWAALLCAACTELADGTGPHHEAASRWARATSLVTGQILANLLSWLPTLPLPVRTGTHDNTAFGMGLCLDAARTLGRDDVVGAVSEHAHRLFDADTDYPSSWEPSGNDFLSAALSEAHLMSRVLEAEDRADGFGPWLHRFLPHLAEPGDTLLDVPRVTSGSDGKLAHLHGLALSRAWQLRALSPWLDEDSRRRIDEATDRQVREVSEQITRGDYMATHWLVSFALQALLVG